MKKLALLGVVMCIIVVGSNVVANAADNPILMKCGHVLPADHPNNLGLQRAGEIIAKQTDNRIQIQTFPLAQLGSAKDMIQATIIGSQQMGLEGGGMFGLFEASFSIMEAPYVFRDIDHMYKIMMGPVGQGLVNELLQKQGLRVLEYFYNGNRHVTTTNRSATKPEDLRGIKLRVPGVKLNIEYGNALGAQATPMPFQEVYMALKQGVIDGQENPLAQIDSGKFYEVQKYLILTGHVMAVMMPYINEKLWQNLSPADRKIIEQAMVEGRKHSNRLVLEGEKNLIDKFKKNGMIVIEPDVKAFRAASMKVVKEFEDKWGKGLYEKIQAVQ